MHVLPVLYVPHVRIVRDNNTSREKGRAGYDRTEQVKLGQGRIGQGSTG